MAKQVKVFSATTSASTSVVVIYTVPAGRVAKVVIANAANTTVYGGIFNIGNVQISFASGSLLGYSGMSATALSPPAPSGYVYISSATNTAPTQIVPREVFLTSGQTVSVQENIGNTFSLRYNFSVVEEY